MSMCEDFAMYYGDSWVGLRRDGKLLPFYVNGTEYRGNDYEDNSDYYTDYNEALRTTEFRGMVIINEEGDTESVRVRGDDPNLELELPDLGYIKTVNGNWVWTAVNIWHTVKKGLIGQRLYNRQVMNHNGNLFRMFNINPDGTELLHRDVLKDGDKLYHKGVQVGEQVSVGQVLIEPEYSLYVQWFSELLPTCQIILKNQP